MIWLRTIGVECCVARSLALESRARADRYDSRHVASAFRRRYFPSRSMGRNNGRKVRLFRISRERYFRKFLFGHVAYDEWGTCYKRTNARRDRFRWYWRSGLSIDARYNKNVYHECTHGTIHVVHYIVQYPMQQAHRLAKTLQNIVTMFQHYCSNVNTMLLQHCESIFLKRTFYRCRSVAEVTIFCDASSIPCCMGNTKSRQQDTFSFEERTVTSVRGLVRGGLYTSARL